MKFSFELSLTLCVFPHLALVSPPPGPCLSPTCPLSVSTAVVIVKGIKDATGGQLSSKVYNVVSHLRKSNM